MLAIPPSILKKHTHFEPSNFDSFTLKHKKFLESRIEFRENTTYPVQNKKKHKEKIWYSKKEIQQSETDSLREIYAHSQNQNLCGPDDMMAEAQIPEKLSEDLLSILMVIYEKGGTDCTGT